MPPLLDIDHGNIWNLRPPRRNTVMGGGGRQREERKLGEKEL
jgi:hypothetical protein